MVVGEGDSVAATEGYELAYSRARLWGQESRRRFASSANLKKGGLGRNVQEAMEVR